MVLLPVTCIGVDVALKYWWRRVRQSDPGNSLRYMLQECGTRVTATAEESVTPKIKRQQDQEHRKVTAEQHHMSFAAQSTLRLSSPRPGSEIRRGMSSSVLGRDDNESNRRSAHITFGRDYLLPQGVPQETSAARADNTF